MRIELWDHNCRTKQTCLTLWSMVVMMISYLSMSEVFMYLVSGCLSISSQTKETSVLGSICVTCCRAHRYIASIFTSICTLLRHTLSHCHACRMLIHDINIFFALVPFTQTSTPSFAWIPVIQVTSQQFKITVSVLKHLSFSSTCVFRFDVTFSHVHSFTCCPSDDLLF